MRTLLLIALGGAVAQLVDGSLGMGFGVTSTTMLIALAAMAPASASAVVHVAQLGTTLASGLSHWKFRNVDWKTALRLGLPGAVGAFAGATVLSNLSLDAAKPVTATILTLIGVHLVLRFSRGRRRTAFAAAPASGPTLSFLGLFGGFIDSVGGGGWGPVTSSTLMSIGRADPRRIVGTVNSAEFLVTLAASVGFVLGMWSEIVSHLLAVAGLLVGGMLAAPFAAWLVSKINPTALGGFVGTMLTLTNIGPLLALTGITGGAATAIYLLLVAAGASLSLLGIKRSRKKQYSYTESVDSASAPVEAEQQTKVFH
ncbi:sulfite exporter TauE/SafE family protein [Rothia aerolata]|uniref:Probable membrane transporter protein n=1 Tax=Rothia aerolata TaxID=1812262 RepID=A0A917MSL2_9MICC|nr:sulfite exporter TauE/SafE family protein [Rothia aerolata]GGH58232.1 UPF0721 transmembrane protein [Rothia aerolata]